jgi:hypothetical protein
MNSPGRGGVRPEDRTPLQTLRYFGFGSTSVASGPLSRLVMRDLAPGRAHRIVRSEPPETAP